MIPLQEGENILTQEQVEYLTKSMKLYEKELARARIRAKRRYVPHPRPKKEKVKVQGRGRGRPRKILEIIPEIIPEKIQEIPSGKTILI